MVCPTCLSPYGKRKRCYVCSGRKRTGETRSCATCQKQFYVQLNVARDAARHSGTYCSRSCKAIAQKGRPQKWAPYGGTIAHSAGYRLLWMPEHPRASRGRVLEHIVVMEKSLGRMLTRGEEVHHLDGNKQNNERSNLILLSASDHARLHVALRKSTLKE